MSTIPTQLPAGFVAYGRSPDFNSENLPAKLRTAHSTKAGTWGLLHVLEGAVFENRRPTGPLNRDLQKLGDATDLPRQVVLQVRVVKHVDVRQFTRLPP